MTQRVTDEQARRVIGGAFAFVEPPSAGEHYRDLAADLLDSRAEIAVLRKVVRVLLDTGERLYDHTKAKAGDVDLVFALRAFNQSLAALATRLKGEK